MFASKQKYEIAADRCNMAALPLDCIGVIIEYVADAALGAFRLMSRECREMAAAAACARAKHLVASDMGGGQVPPYSWRVLVYDNWYIPFGHGTIDWGRSILACHDRGVIAEVLRGYPRSTRVFVHKIWLHVYRM